MNYTRIYNAIIDKRIKNPLDLQEYGEDHHITPRSLGGLDDKSNLVRLTAREHFLCHLLLVKMHRDGSGYFKMVKAFLMMKDCHGAGQQRWTNSRRYERLRKESARYMADHMAIAMAGTSNPNFGKVWCIRKTDIEAYQQLRCEGKPSAGPPKGISKAFSVNQIPNDWVSLKELQRQEKNFKRIESQKQKIKHREEMTRKYRELFKIYSEHGFTKFCELTGYTKSQTSLTWYFNHYLDEFKPQPGIPRTPLMAKARRDKIRAKALNRNKETREKLSVALKKKWKDPEYREKMLAR